VANTLIRYTEYKVTVASTAIGQQFILNQATYHSMTEIVENEDHSGGAPTINDTGIRVLNVASAYEHSGYSPDEIAELYPALSLADIHAALAYYYDHIEVFRESMAAAQKTTESAA